MASTLADKLHHLSRWFQDHDQVAVAYSGGVDSALLLYLGTRILGCKQCSGLFADSGLVSKRIRTVCLEYARQYDLAIQTIPVEPLQYESFRENKKDRCYICKKQTYLDLLNHIPAGTVLVDGTNLTDLKTDRPGLPVLTELDVVTPFLDCNITKFDIRSLSYHLGLSTWDCLAESCLATRIKPGVLITKSDLQYLEQIETDFDQIGLKGCRVRYDKKALFLTVHTGQLKQILDQDLFKNIKAIGLEYEFTKVFLDLFEREGILPSLLDYIGFVDNIAPPKQFLNYFNNMSK